MKQGDLGHLELKRQIIAELETTIDRLRGENWAMHMRIKTLEADVSELKQRLALRV